MLVFSRARQIQLNDNLNDFSQTPLILTQEIQYKNTRRRSTKAERENE